MATILGPALKCDIIVYMTVRGEKGFEPHASELLHSYLLPVK